MISGRLNISSLSGVLYVLLPSRVYETFTSLQHAFLKAASTAVYLLLSTHAGVYAVTLTRREGGEAAVHGIVMLIGAFHAQYLPPALYVYTVGKLTCVKRTVTWAVAVAPPHA